MAEPWRAAPSEVVFTSGGRADNLAVKGLYWARRAGSRPGDGAGDRHRAPRSTGQRALARRARCRSRLGCPWGQPAPWPLRSTASVALISVMWADDEVAGAADDLTTRGEHQIPFAPTLSRLRLRAAGEPRQRRRSTSPRTRSAARGALRSGTLDARDTRALAVGYASGGRTRPSGSPHCVIA